MDWLQLSDLSKVITRGRLRPHRKRAIINCIPAHERNLTNCLPPAHETDLTNCHPASERDLTKLSPCTWERPMNCLRTCDLPSAYKNECNILLRTINHFIDRLKQQELPVEISMFSIHIMCIITDQSNRMC